MGDKKEGKTTYGLLGSNIGYSLSPVMHNFAFRYFGINAEYKIFDTKPEEVRSFLGDLAKSALAGVNVTVPYKVTVKDIMLENRNNRIEEFALKLGAVNTIRYNSGYLEGFNTDGPGFAESLKDDLGLTPGKLAGGKVLLLGAGGAARAVSFYLAGSNFSPGIIYVCDTAPGKALELSSALKAIYGNSMADAIDEKDAPLLASQCCLVVNATPLGTKEGEAMPLLGGFPGGKAALYDLVYARETELVRSWRQKGFPATGGLGMLVNQAVLAFNLWTGEKYALEDIKSAMRSSLSDEMKEQYGWNIS
jgi:shikimate dehydrogenase